jgi:hypothetical protein
VDGVQDRRNWTREQISKELSPMEAHLVNRAKTYFNQTGIPPTPAMLERWELEYMNRQERIERS